MHQTQKPGPLRLLCPRQRFYDFALEQDCCVRTELTQEALDWAGSRTELLDAYAWWTSAIGEIRVGRQVLNWGESTFIQGGI